MVSIRFQAILISVLGIAGCNRGEEITSYTTPRSEPPRESIDYSVVAQQLDRTLAAILPQGSRAWFFKLAGPAPVIERRRNDFLAFLKTVGPAPSATAPPTWRLPEGWEEKPPASEFITTVLVVPDDSGPLELTVSSLELSGDWQDFVAMNVNRWLVQLSQAPLELARITSLSKPVETPAGTATVIELAGINAKSARGNPHEGMADAAPVAKPPVGGPLVYETPAGWQPGRTSAMRTAAFTIMDGDQQAEVTVIPLPTSAGPQITDVAANVQRWAGQVGLTGLDAAALAKLTESIQISGTDGSYVSLGGPTDTERPAGLLAAMVEHGGKVWFFKLSGDLALVKSQQDAFKKFLESVRFQ